MGLQVIGAGLGRTGTLSMKAALERLGFGPCLHMVDVIGHAAAVPTWRAALEGEPVDWEAGLGDWRSTIDWPGCTFYEELMDAFPEAKLILNEREPDAWYESTRNSIYQAYRAAAEGALAGGSLQAPDAEAMGVIVSSVWEGERSTFGGRFEDREYAIAAFEEHNESVKRKVSPERLLVYEIGDGWGSLCEFLGVDAPDEPFPHLNDTGAFREMVGLPPLEG